MPLTIVLCFLSAALDAYFGYLLYTLVSPWSTFILVALALPTFVALWVVWLLVLLIWGFFLNTKKEINRPNRFYYRIMKDADFIFLWICRVKIVKRGLSLPKDQKFCIISNHVSGFDQLVMIKAIKQTPMVWVSKPENMKKPFAGPFIHHSGFIPINRENMTEGIKGIEKAGEYLKNNLCSVGIAPEGTRNKTDQAILPFHPGSFRIAQYGEAPLVITCLKNTNEIKHRSPWRRTIVYFDVLEIIPKEQVLSMSTADLAHHAEMLVKEDLSQEDF